MASDIAAADTVQSYMDKLAENGEYKISDVAMKGLSKFYGGFADVEETNKTIGEMYEKNNYLMDTHTAVAYKVYKDYVSETGDNRPTLIASTASPYKFARSVAESIGINGCKNDFGYVEELSKTTGVEIPEGLRDLNKKEVLHKDVIEVREMADAIFRRVAAK